MRETTARSHQQLHSESRVAAAPAANPLISVIMSVYNEEQYLAEALESIRQQTYENWEMIIIDDCSTDRTPEILREFCDKDRRIHTYRNETNQGLTVNLNRALAYAQGDYIARMDGDDLSRADRFERQLAYLHDHPELMLISCRTETFGQLHLQSDVQGTPEVLRCRMLVRPVLAHPGFMARAEIYREQGYRYDESFQQAQDYEFAARLTGQYSIGICPQILLEYRAHKGQVSSKSGSKQFANADRVRAYLLAELGIELTEAEWTDYHRLVLEERTGDIQAYQAVMRILERIETCNKERQIYDPQILKETLGELMADWMIRSKRIGVFLAVGRILRGNRVYRQAYRRELGRIIKNKIHGAA